MPLCLLFRQKVFVIVDGLKNIQRFMKLRNPKIGEMSLERLVDESILHEFEKAGFSTRLWAAKRRLVKERMNLWPLME